jgi:hypothetical protein
VPRRVLVRTLDGLALDLAETPAPNEEHLQEVMKDHPNLLPIDDLGISGPLLVVGRETTLASGSIDLLGVVPSGDVVLIEFKTGPQNPDFRHALAQLIDYGSDLWGSSLEEFDSLVRRYLSGDRCPVPFRGLPGIEALTRSVWTSPDFDWEAFQAQLTYVLAEGDFHYVVAAQRFTPPMLRSLSYLNQVSRVGTYHLVQMLHLQGEAARAYSAQLVSAPSRGRRSATTSATTEAEFLATIRETDQREALEQLFARCRSLRLSFEWGSKGTSIRMATPDRSEPISIGWAFPEGRHWYGLRHLSLGYDTATAQQTPSVLPALQAYAERLAQIPRGVPAKATTLNAWTWEPGHLPEVGERLVSALEQLVVDAAGEESP